MAIKVEIYFGLNDKETKRQEITTAAAFDLVSKSCVKYFGFGTLSEARGVFSHSDGSGAIVEEKTIRVELFFMDTDSKPGACKMVFPFVDELKKALNQESVLSSFVLVDTVMF